VIRTATEERMRELLRSVVLACALGVSGALWLFFHWSA
jgi:hypothetical protein